MNGDTGDGPVERWLSKPLGNCPWCGKPAFPTTPRGLDDQQRIGHLECVQAVVGQCSVCGKPVTRQDKREERDQSVVHDSCLKRR